MSSYECKAVRIGGAPGRAGRCSEALPGRSPQAPALWRAEAAQGIPHARAQGAARLVPMRLPGWGRDTMRPAIVAQAQGAGRIPSPTPHKQPFPQGAIRAGPPTFRLGGIKARDLLGDTPHDLRVPLGRLRRGIALERQADGGIVLLDRTDNATPGLDIRDGFVCCCRAPSVSPALFSAHEYN